MGTSYEEVPMPNLDSMKTQILLLETMLNSVGTFIYGKDTEGRYIYANQTVLDLFGMPLAQVLGKDDSHFFDMPLSKQLKENDNKVICEGITVENEESNVVKATGQIHIYKVIKKPMFDDSGAVIGLCGVSTDITKEKQLDKLVRQQKHLLDTVLDNIDAHVYMKNSEREFLYVNSKTAALFGRPVEQIIGCKENDILPAEMADHFYKSDAMVFNTGEKQIINEEVIDENGNKLHYLSVKVPLDRQGELPALIGFSSDVTELYQLKEQFRQQANTDPLTQLYNRRYFVTHAEKEFQRAKRYNSSLALVSLDIDNFKKVNDQYGHPVGDKVLQALAKKLAPMIRSEDILARIGGEEFSILLPETSIDVAQRVAERIRIEQQKSVFDGDIVVTISLGVAGLIPQDQSFDQLFRRADKALYQAKKLGKNRVAIVLS